MQKRKFFCFASLMFILVLCFLHGSVSLNPTRRNLIQSVDCKLRVDHKLRVSAVYYQAHSVQLSCHCVSVQYIVTSTGSSNERTAEH